MTTVLIVDKKGSIKETSLKTVTLQELCKKAGFKSTDGFICQTKWNIEIKDKTYSISLYGKTEGRANQENKYEFPPPVDTVLFFGNCILTNTDEETDEFKNLTEKEWLSIYDELYGGFEDIEDETSEFEDSEEDEDGRELTKSGYVKDDFVVDDNASDYEEEDDEEESDEEEDSEVEEEVEEEEVFVKKSSSKAVAKSSKKKTTGKSVFAAVLASVQNEGNYLDCTSELEEEEYI